MNIVLPNITDSDSWVSIISALLDVAEKLRASGRHETLRALAREAVSVCRKLDAAGVEQDVAALQMYKEAGLSAAEAAQLRMTVIRERRRLLSDALLGKREG